MGTRAAFWIGNPTNLENRQWLGCIAFDGYAHGVPGLQEIKSEPEFRGFVLALKSRSDFSHPGKGWPFPWDDDIFVTDYNYAFFDVAVNVAIFHCGWMSWDQAFSGDYDDKRDKLPKMVAAPEKYNSEQPDSIMIITNKRAGGVAIDEGGDND